MRVYAINPPPLGSSTNHVSRPTLLLAENILRTRHGRRPQLTHFLHSKHKVQKKNVVERKSLQGKDLEESSMGERT